MYYRFCYYKLALWLRLGLGKHRFHCPPLSWVKHHSVVWQYLPQYFAFSAVSITIHIQLSYFMVNVAIESYFSVYVWLVLYLILSLILQNVFWAQEKNVYSLRFKWNALEISFNSIVLLMPFNFIMPLFIFLGVLFCRWLMIGLCWLQKLQVIIVLSCVVFSVWF